MNRRAYLVALAALAALSIVFFWKIALTNLILGGVDIFTYFYPYRAAVNEALAAGRLPLWNPDLFMGVPLLANAQAGALYPLNWPLVGLPAPQAINVSIVLHVFLAGAFFYLFARDVLHLPMFAAFGGACVFACGGYVGSLVEHVNQLQAAVWFPLLLWCFERARSARNARFVLLGGAVLALQLLAGHAQVTYISLFALGMWAITPTQISDFKIQIENARRLSANIVARLSTVLGMCVIATGLSAVQLLPTLELSRLSIRGGGMMFREAVAFSLPLSDLLVSLLPTYGFGAPVFSEYIAFVGVLALVCALFGIARAWRTHFPLLLLVLAGVALAVGSFNPLYVIFYKVLPGFGLFRAPARWLFLYVFAVSGFAGIGLQRLVRRFETSSGRWRPTMRMVWPRGLLVAIMVELFIATRSLPYNQPTAPEAYSFLRPAIAFLLSRADGQPSRILSYSDLVWDPGDLMEIHQMFAGQLSSEAIYQYTVAAKAKEIVAPNLALRYHLQSVDGYDGGILPLARFVGLESLFLSAEQVNPDGRLRERLRAIPAARWLDLFNVRYIIADKVFDVWVEGNFYDLGLGLDLDAADRSEHSVDVPTDFATTGMGVISYLRGGASIANGTPVAELLATDSLGKVHSFVLRAGEDTAESEYRGEVAHAQARAVHTLRDQPNAHEYQALFNFDSAVKLQALSIRALQPAGEVVVHGVTLIDASSITGKALVLAPAGHFRLDQSGDIKLYEYTDVAPRAQVVHRVAVIADDNAALARMSQRAFDTRAEIVLADGQAIENDAAATTATVSLYEPEHIMLSTYDPAEGYLFLKDAWYPGWRAWVDGQPASIERADTYFRAVHLDAGPHRVEFRFEPESLRWGAALTALSLLACAATSVWFAWRLRRS